MFLVYFLIFSYIKKVLIFCKITVLCVFQGTLIQHLKEHVLHGNMTSSDVIIYYTTVGPPTTGGQQSSSALVLLISLVVADASWPKRSKRKVHFT